MTKILLVNPNSRSSGANWTVLPPLGLLYVGTVLSLSNHTVKVLDVDIANLGIDATISKALEFRPNVIGLSLNCGQLGGGYQLVRAMKESLPNVPIVVGGPHPSAMKAEIFLECPEVDVVVVGEGEQTMLELVEAIAAGAKLESVKGIIYKEDGTAVSNPSRPYMENLDELPQPNYDLLDGPLAYPGAYPVGAHPQIHVMAGRGCPFQCTFCNDSVWGTRVRFRSPESIVDEIEAISTRFKAREAFLTDDTLNIKKSYLLAICDEIIARNLHEKLIFKIPMRADKKYIDKQLLDRLKEAGFWMLFYGVETGSSEMMSSINKRITHEEIIRAFELTADAGMKTLASFMIGNIGESRRTAKETFKFFKKLDPDFSGLAVAIPFPGTRFFADAKKKGLLRKENFEEFRFGTAMTDTGFLTTREVEDLAGSYREKMLAYKKSASRRIRRIIKAGRGQSLKEALCHSKNDYEQFKTGQMAFSYDKVPLLFLDYEKTFELKYNLVMEGWHDPENHDGRYVCWSRGRAKVVLKYDPSFTTLNVKYFVGHPDSDRNPVRITVDAGSSNRRVFSVSSNEWSEFQMPLRLLEKKDRLIISLAVNRTFNPMKLGMGEDQRDLGLLVERIWLSSPRGQE